MNTYFEIFFDPLAWCGKLQRTYMATVDESVLEEVGDIGRLMAVTGIPVENVLDVHSSVLIEEVGRAGTLPAELVARADICLAELLVGWRLAAESVGALEQIAELRAAALPPLYLWFEPGGRLLSLDTPNSEARTDPLPWLEASTLDGLVTALSGARRTVEIREAIAQAAPRLVRGRAVARPAPSARGDLPVP